MAEVTIAELAASGALTFGDGYRTKRSEHGTPGYRILRVADVADGRVDLDGPDFVSDEHERAIGPKVSQAGDVLLTTKGTVGRVAIFPADVERVVYSPQLCYFRVTEPKTIHPRFLAYWFKSEAFVRQASHRANNTDMAAYINLGDIASLSLDLPGTSEQRAIAEVLGAFDDKIAANTQAARTADELIEAHYAAAIAVEGASSQLLFDVLDIVFGEAFKGDSFSEPGVGRPLIRIRDLKTASPQVWTTEARPRETLILPGDVVVGMDAEFRASWWLGEPGLLNQRVLRATAKHASTAFAAMALKRPLSALEGEKSATTVIHLNKSDLARSSVMVPGAGALARFDAVAEPIRLARVALALENRKLAVTRDELLPLLMSGKVRIKEAEKTMEGML